MVAAAAAAALVVVAAAVADTSYVDPVEFRAAAGADRRQASANQEVSTAARELLGGDHGDRKMAAAAAAAQVMYGTSEAVSGHELSPSHRQLATARARCSSARRLKKPELLLLASRGIGQQGARRVPCW
uniref:VAN3-binding protein-like auxin canalisation domain-containing protein n=1 Tax=Arundo donax TaxID=35708 RepID=A0A0A9E961_ARUDO